MIKIISIILLLHISLFAQSGANNIFLSPDNVKKFAGYLFCRHDYLRSVEEYKRYLKSTKNDTVDYIIGEAYSRMGNYTAAADYYLSAARSSSLGSIAHLSYLRSVFQMDNLAFYRNTFNKEKINPETAYYNDALSLYNFSFLFESDNLPGKNNFLKPFKARYKTGVEKLYDYRAGLSYKSPVTAAILSALIPGAGKIYTRDYADGIVAFLTAGTLSYIAYSDFHARHNFRGWLFTALASGFYAGNIYGSAASAQIFNVKIKFDFTEMLKSYLKKVNYFVPMLNFCEK